MPSRVLQLPDAHTDDVLDYSVDCEGFGTGDNVASYTVTVPAGVTLADDSSTGQIINLRLGPATAATHRIIVAAVSVAGQNATVEIDWTVSNPS